MRRLMCSRCRRPMPRRPTGLSGHRQDERGATLVEMMVVLLTMGILLAIAIPIVSTLLQTTSKVDATYSNVDEQLWLGTNLQRLVRSAVAPTPSPTPATGQPPAPAFVPGSITPTSMSFTTNTGTPAGPEKVVAKCTPPTPVHPTRCKVTSTFTVTVYRAQTSPSPPHASYCPQSVDTFVNHCSWTTAGKGAVTKKVLITIPHVRNAAATPPIPLFVFSYGPPPTPGKPMTTTTVCAMTGVPAGCSSTDAATFGTGGTATRSNCQAATGPGSLFARCPAGEIEHVAYDLLINAKTTARYGGAQAEDDTGIFVLSSTSMLFDPSVG